VDAHPAGVVFQSNRAVGAVADKEDLAAAHPPLEEPETQEHQVFQGSMPPATGLVLLLRPVQETQDRKCPWAAGEGQLDQDGQDHPLVPEAVCEHSLGRPDRIPVTSHPIDIGARSALRRIVSSHQHLCTRGHESHDQAGEHAGQVERRPTGTAPEAVIRREVFLRPQERRHPKHLRHGPAPLSQDGARQQETEVLVSRGGHAWAKGLQQDCERGDGIQHPRPPLRNRCSVT